MTTKQFTVGEKVRLVSKRKTAFEEENWLLRERPIPKVGDEFIVRWTNGLAGWIRVTGLSFDHPASKFTKVEDEI